MGRNQQHEVVFRLSPDDISALRFAVSPGMELAAAVRVLLDPGQHPLHWGWVRSVGRAAAGEEVALLGTLVGTRGYLPDFLTSEAAWDLTPETELARLRSLDPAVVHDDLRRLLPLTTGARRARLERMAADPLVARDRVAHAWEGTWAAVVEPHRDSLERLTRADIGARARRATQHGVGAMVGSLHERVSWRDDAVVVQLRTHSEVVDCTGHGLLLVPSVFLRSCAVMTQATRPALHYPVHGLSETWSRPAAEQRAALVALLGEGRARVLEAVAEPLSTSEAAQACSLVVSTASHHLGVLRAAGLVESRRQGRMVLHARTPLGDAVASRGVP